MKNRLKIFLKILISFSRYFIGYLLVIIISEYNLIYNVGEREITIGLLLAILGTVGLIVKTIISLKSNIETPETQLLKKLKNN